MFNHKCFTQEDTLTEKYPEARLRKTHNRHTIASDRLGWRDEQAVPQKTPRVGALAASGWYRCPVSEVSKNLAV